MNRHARVRDDALERLRRAALLASLLAVSIAALVLPTAGCGSGECGASDGAGEGTLASDIIHALEFLNMRRTEHGLPLVSLDPALNEFALASVTQWEGTAATDPSDGKAPPADGAEHAYYMSESKHCFGDPDSESQGWQSEGWASMRTTNAELIECIIDGFIAEEAGVGAEVEVCGLTAIVRTTGHYEDFANAEFTKVGIGLIRTDYEIDEGIFTANLYLAIEWSGD